MVKMLLLKIFLQDSLKCPLLSLNLHRYVSWCKKLLHLGESACFTWCSSFTILFDLTFATQKIFFKSLNSFNDTFYASSASLLTSCWSKAGVSSLQPLGLPHKIIQPSGLPQNHPAHLHVKKKYSIFLPLVVLKEIFSPVCCSSNNSND